VGGQVAVETGPALGQSVLVVIRSKLVTRPQSVTPVAHQTDACVVVDDNAHESADTHEQLANGVSGRGKQRMVRPRPPGALQAVLGDDFRVSGARP